MKIIEKLKNKIINTDAKKLLKLLPDRSIDLILTDPCYGIDYTGQLSKKLGGLGLSITKHGWKDYGAKNYTWDKNRTSPEIIKEF